MELHEVRTVDGCPSCNLNLCYNSERNCSAEFHGFGMYYGLRVKRGWEPTGRVLDWFVVIVLLKYGGLVDDVNFILNCIYGPSRPVLATTKGIN